MTAPIVGPTKVEHLTDALAAIDLELGEAEVEALEAPYRPAGGLGPRLSPQRRARAGYSQPSSTGSSASMATSIVASPGVDAGPEQRLDRLVAAHAQVPRELAGAQDRARPLALGREQEQGQRRHLRRERVARARPRT